MAYQYRAGLGSVGNYQVSGIPFLTGALSAPASGSAPLELVFPSVTQKIYVHNHNPQHDIKIGFSANGVKGSNYWYVHSDSTANKGHSEIELRVKCDRIFIISEDSSPVTGVYVAAELTGIVLDHNLNENYSGSSGIG